MFPIPPRMTMQRTMIEMLNEKRVGEDVLYERTVVGARHAAEDRP